MTNIHAHAVLSAVRGRKSTYSEESACVAIAAIPGYPWVGIQDLKWVTPDGSPTVVVPSAEFRRFIDGLH